MLLLVLSLAVVGQSTALLSVDFYMHTRNGSHKLEDNKLPDFYDRNKETVVVLHGFTSSNEGECADNIINSLVDYKDANVISSNHTGLSNGYVLSYLVIAESVCDFLLENKVDPNNTRVIGHSLGAHIAGALRTCGFLPYLIIGLDPARPAFSLVSDQNRLTPDSAPVVLVIHSNAGRLGTEGIDGTTDVYINNGNDFPCCDSDSCNHNGACHALAYTIRKKTLYGRQCRSKSAARSSWCFGRTVRVGYDMPLFKGIVRVSLRQCVATSYDLKK